LFEINDGKRFVSSSYDSTLRLWSLDGGGGKCLVRFVGHSKAVRCVLVLKTRSNHSVLVSGSEDGSIKLWRIPEHEEKEEMQQYQECFETFEGHTGGVWALCELEKKIIASGSFDKTVKLWRPSRGGCIRTLVGHSNSVRGVVSLGRRRLLASCSADKTIRFWNRATGQCLHSFLAHPSAINCIIKLSSEKWCSSRCGGSDVIVAPAVSSASFVSASWDGSIRGWSETGECLFCCGEGEGEFALPSSDSVTCVAQLSDGCIASGCANGVIEIWKMPTHRLIYLSTLSNLRNITLTEALLNSLVELCCVAVARHYELDVIKRNLPEELYETCEVQHLYLQKILNEQYRKRQSSSSSFFDVIKTFFTSP